MDVRGFVVADASCDDMQAGKQAEDMPTRVTRSFSRKGLFGGRVRYTTSRLVGAPRANAQPRQPNVQIHLTGRDLLEMEQRQQEAARTAEAARQQQLTEFQARGAEMRAQEATVHLQHMAALARPARWLHTRAGAGVTLGVFALGWIVAFALGWPWLLMLQTLALAIIDWRNFSSFHNVIPWRVWQVSGHMDWWASLGLGLLLFGWLFMPAVYGVQTWRGAGALSAADQAALKARIATLEAELLPPPDVAQDAPPQSE